MSTQNDLENPQGKKKNSSLNQEEKEITLKLTTSSALDNKNRRYLHFTNKEERVVSNIYSF